MTVQINGCRDLNLDEVEKLNEIQEYADHVGGLVENMTEICISRQEIAEDEDEEASASEALVWIERAEAQLQMGFMLLRRAVTLHEGF